MFWSSSDNLIRILVMAPLVYLSLIVILRVTGKRMLSKMNAFDFVITIALGSTLASVVLSKDIVLAEGVFALALLIGLQYVIAWTSTRSRRVNRWIKSDPTLLFYRGQFLQSALLKENVSEDALRAGMRSSGHAAMDDVEAVVLESDGTVSIIRPTQTDRLPLLDQPNGPDLQRRLRGL